VVQGVPGRLRPGIILTFRHYKGSRSSAKRTGRLYPRRNPWYSLSEAESTSGHMVLSGVPWKKSPVTPPRIDPGTVRLAAQRHQKVKTWTNEMERKRLWNLLQWLPRLYSSTWWTHLRWYFSVNYATTSSWSEFHYQEVALTGETINPNTIVVGKPEEKRTSEVPTRGQENIEWIAKKYGVKLCTGFICPANGAGENSGVS